MQDCARLALVADGHADCGETLALALELAEWRVCTLDDGEDVLVWLRHWTPQAVVLDAKLPTVQGLSVARVMRASARLDATTIVLTDTWPDATARTQALAAGVDSVWIKPFETAGLMRRLDQQQRRAAAARRH